jgi:prepilin-type N-terminal cleavage/methylation domain-containing protein
MQYPRNPRRRNGFTVIEILVVVGIIAILASIAIVGIGKIIESQRQTQTRTVLSSVQSMLAEFDRETALRRQPPHQWDFSNGAPSAPTDFWRDASPATVGMTGLQSTGDLSPENDDVMVVSPLPSRQHLPEVKNTQLAMYMFNQVSTVKKILSAMPDGSLTTIVDDPATNTPPYDEHAVGVPKDAWGNLMIFVPASGLRGVYLADSNTEYVVTSAKTYLASALPDGTIAPGARPFFASPGPDGRLGGFDATTGKTYGDDNLYSFENK